MAEQGEKLSSTGEKLQEPMKSWVLQGMKNFYLIQKDVQHVLQNDPVVGPGDFCFARQERFETLFAVIGLEGKRGVGKSTLLRRLSHELYCQGHLVLETLTPAQILHGNSLLAHVLSQLVVRLRGCREALQQVPGSSGSGHEHGARGDGCAYDRKPEARPVVDRALKALDVYRDRHARYHSASFEALRASGKVGEEQIWQYNRAVESQHDPECTLEAVLRQVLDFWKVQRREDRQPRCRVSGASGSWDEEPWLVVPLDDCDLHPEMMQVLFDDVFLLAQTPRVVVLFPYHPGAMHRLAGYRLIQHMQPSWSALKDMGLSENGLFAQEVADFVYKVFPPAYRVVLPGFERYEDRLNFRPLGVTDAESMPRLLDLLNACHLPEDSKLDFKTLGALFDVSPEVKGGDKQKLYPSDFCELLSDLPRVLSNLYSLLQRVLQVKGWKYEKQEGEQKSNGNRCVVDAKDVREFLQVLKTGFAGSLPYREQKELDRRIRWGWDGKFKMDLTGSDFEGKIEERARPTKIRKDIQCPIDYYSIFTDPVWREKSADSSDDKSVVVNYPRIMTLYARFGNWAELCLGGVPWFSYEGTNQLLIFEKGEGGKARVAIDFAQIPWQYHRMITDAWNGWVAGVEQVPEDEQCQVFIERCAQILRMLLQIAYGKDNIDVELADNGDVKAVIEFMNGVTDEDVVRFPRMLPGICAMASSMQKLLQDNQDEFGEKVVKKLREIIKNDHPDLLSSIEFAEYGQECAGDQQKIIEPGEPNPQREKKQ
ncbi:MAG: hypothetical protein H7831_09660 [Magnetococcus sp. WYHC-3]